MILFIGLLLFVIGNVNSMKIIEHFNTNEVHGLSLRAIDNSDALWIIMIKREKTTKLNETFYNNLEETCKIDQCHLIKSGTDKKQIILKIYCDKYPTLQPKVDKINSNAPNNEKKEMKKPPFNNTFKLLKQTFGKENIHLEKSVRITKPRQWYGNLGNIEDSTNLMYGKFNFTARGLDKETFKGYYINRQLRKDLYSSNLFQSSAPWGLDRIDMRFGALSGDYHYTNEANNISAYILDTGILATHNDFEGRATFLYNPVDSINTDCHGHGTHVAGIIGSKSYGVAKKCLLYGVKVLNCAGDGGTFEILAGVNKIIEHATAANPPKRVVVNLSLGGDKSTLLDNAVLSLKNHGYFVSVAGGNEGSSACNYSPSNLGLNNAILSVGASDIHDNRPSWGNYGSCISISAPGVSIRSTWIGSSNTAEATISGTSMSSPFVCGVGALLLQDNASLTVNEAYNLVLQYATPSVISPTTSTGGGKNLLYSLIDPMSPPSTPTVQPLPQLNSATSTTYQLKYIIYMIFVYIVFI